MRIILKELSGARGELQVRGQAFQPRRIDCPPAIKLVGRTYVRMPAIFDCNPDEVNYTEIHVVDLG